MAIFASGEFGAAHGQSSLCSIGSAFSGTCNGSIEPDISNGGVNLGAEETRRGAPAGSAQAPRFNGGASNWAAGRGLIGGRRFGDSCSPELGCGTLEPLPSGAPAEPEASVAEVTIRDVASFAPGPVADEMEPGWGIAVRRLPANFISGATEQVVEGMLLGRPAAVRFTPVGFGWDTGDGGRVEASTAGATWERLGQKELTDTATSHRYEERGFYDVQPTVTYAAEYRFDGSAWIPIVGTLDVAGAPYRVRVVTVETRLTRGDCIRYPNDPGCR
ncbi:hypothetical protein [Agromyces aerolatus]|uniref:hypothetical protein n=1 Tax=Agromyces sp. LY-1074 TaxID=3074080 RepID=UPI00286471D4|nr:MULTISPECIES: hypothetical protein [unclassified Agromyces]MDR5700254.1 hypothetical protein [Agromyces sp. LY-1074]MDR5706768.1 hypothetical protein [Agromyces sp. LY-1358]